MPSSLESQLALVPVAAVENLVQPHPEGYAAAEVSLWQFVERESLDGCMVGQVEGVVQMIRAFIVRVKPQGVVPTNRLD